MGSTKSKMPERRLPCQWADCTLGEEEEEGGRYSTPSHLSTVDQAVKLLELHSRAHEAGVRRVITEGVLKPKLAKIERPKMEFDMNDKDWILFLSEWRQFKQSRQLTIEKEIVAQLWGCLTKALRREAIKEGLEEEDTEEGILTRLRKLVVRTGYGVY